MGSAWQGQIGGLGSTLMAACRLALWVEDCSNGSSKLSVSQIRGSCLLCGDTVRKHLLLAGRLPRVLDVGPLLGYTEGRATASLFPSGSHSPRPVLW